jgi:hypothetical protein
MTDETPRQPRTVNGGAKPALAPVDGCPSTVNAIPDGRAGKPALAPVDVAPPRPATSAPSPPQPTPPSGGQE